MSQSAFIRIEVRTDCPTCSQSLPLNAPKERLRCAFCGSPVLVPVPDLAEIFQYIESHYAEETDEDDEYALSAEEEARARQETILGEGCELRFEFGPASPTCANCGQLLPVGELTPVERQELTCACGTAYVSLPATAAQAAQIDGALQLVSAEPSEDPAQQATTQGSCPQCGAELTISRDTRRVCPCQFCDAQLFLPGDVWTRLHPPPKLQPWYVRFLEG